MEVIVSPQGHKQSLHASVCKTSSSNLHNDLWIAVRRGSLADVDLALALLKKNGGSINSRNSFGLTPLHIATWRNHIPIVRKLLVAGADPNARYLRQWDIRERHAVDIPYYVLEILKDGESGWSSLHRALHFGHLAVASVLLQFGASITLEDSKFRTPVDLLSGPLSQVVGSDNSSVVTEVFSWGSGANYQLGTGNEHVQKLPCKVDSLHDNFIKLISASKFHSVAVSAFGEVYTWGFGRGGRLGHPDFDIHSGQAAVITPRQVTFGLGSRRVKAVAAAKHHTVIATESGDVFTWGSNREGQLGYTSVDTQPTPRRVSSLKSKIVAVAAANKHTAVVSEAGEIFTWGCNKEGQLGYGTSNSASNYTPRVVEYLKGKIFVGVAAAKYHTIVLGNDGEVYTWGHRLVTPRRVVIARNLKKSGATPLKFHRMERLHVFAVAAGMVYSLALTDDGALFYWISSDPNLRCQQLYSLCGRNIVNISAGKYWTSAVTSTGDVYMWDGKTNREKPPIVARVNGIKTATSVSVGETHLLIIGSLYHPVYPCSQTKAPEQLMLRDEADEFTEDLPFNDIDSNNKTPLNDDDNNGPIPIPSLKSLCEKVAAECLVEPRNALQLLEIADSLGADDLRKHCEDIVIRNLAYIFSVVSQSVASAPLDILADLEKSLDLMSSEAWSHRRLPTPTATFPAIIYSEEENSESEILQMRESSTLAVLKSESGQKLDSFLKPKVDHHEAMCKQVRALRKKLQQIEMLEVKQSRGQVLDEQQIAKLQSKSILETSLVELGVPVDAPPNQSSSVCPVGKGNRSSEQSKRHRRKSKQKVELKTSSGVSRNEVEPTCTKDGPQVEILSVLKHKEEDTLSSGYRADETGDASSIVFAQKKTNPNVTKNNTSSPAASKKKNRKGGLSMFLSGALDDARALKVPAPSPPTPKIEGPAWGGVKISKGSPSLREIQVEQSKILGSQASRNKDHVEDQIQSSSYFPSKPIPVTSTCALQKLDGEKNTPPWAASGTPPQLSRPSLRDIQIQQLGKHSHSPRTSTAGFAVSTSQISPSDSGVVNRWFKPEVDTPSSIRSIQIEEKAMKDLRRFYSSVKIVKNQT